MSKLPKGISLTPLDPDYRDAPYRVLGAARAQCPAYYDEELSRYVLLNAADVREVLRDKRHGMDASKANDGTFPQRFPEFIVADENSMLALDDPDHRRLRSVISKAFTPSAAEALRPAARHHAEALLERIDANRPVEFISAFARPFPTLMIATMLGVDPRQQVNFERWADTSVRGFFNVLASAEEKAAARAANSALRAFFAQHIERVRETPDAGLISWMVAAQAQGAPLTDEEIITQCNLLLVAGSVTITDLLGSLLLRLLQHPEQLAAVRADPDLAPAAIEETLRFDPPVDASARVIGADRNFGGCPVGRGEYATLSLMAANHDPAVQPNPDSFDIHRSHIAHLSFGGGAHYCLGASLARVEATEALLAILRQFPQLQLAAGGYEICQTPQFRGVETLWLDAQHQRATPIPATRRPRRGALARRTSAVS